jgi:hypothetical protein
MALHAAVSRRICAHRRSNRRRSAGLARASVIRKADGLATRGSIYCDIRSYSATGEPVSIVAGEAPIDRANLPAGFLRRDVKIFSMPFTFGQSLKHAPISEMTVGKQPLPLIGKTGQVGARLNADRAQQFVLDSRCRMVREGVKQHPEHPQANNPFVRYIRHQLTSWRNGLRVAIETRN